jgi:hypothetical protein
MRDARVRARDGSDGRDFFARRDDRDARVGTVRWIGRVDEFVMTRSVLRGLGCEGCRAGERANERETDCVFSRPFVLTTHR